MILFDLRQAHSQVDEFVRKLLFEFIESREVIFDISIILIEMKSEMIELLNIYSDCNDEDIIHKLKYFIDILEYVCYKVLLFEETFRSTPGVFSDILLSYTSSHLKSINYVYNYFLERVDSKENQSILFKSGSGFNTIYNITKISNRTRTKTPRYLRKSYNDKTVILEEDIDPLLIKTKRKNSVTNDTRKDHKDDTKLYPKSKHR